MSERDESTNEDGNVNEEGTDEAAGEAPAESPSEAPPQDTAQAASEAAAEDAADGQEEPQVDTTSTVEILPDETERLRRQLDESSARLRAVSKAYKDLQTEMDAFRRRQQVLAEAKAEKRAGQVVERFFEPVQNLRRALDQKDVSAEDLRLGVGMVLKQFVGRMEELGLKEIPGVGSPFDPKVHDALAQLPVADESMNGKIIEVYATGWQVGERVIQPAQVVVGLYQPPAEA